MPSFKVTAIGSLLLIGLFLTQMNSASSAIPDWLEELLDTVEQFLGIVPESQQCNCTSDVFCKEPNSGLCPEDEIFINEGSTCDINCAYYGRSCIVATLVPAKGCYCKPFYARLNNGTCALFFSNACRAEYLPDEQYNAVPYFAADCSNGPDGEEN